MEMPIARVYARMFTHYPVRIRDGSYKTGDVPYATTADGVMGNRFVDDCLKSAREDKWIDL